MFSTVSQITSSLTSMIDRSDEQDFKSYHEKIARMKYSQFQQILCLINNQQPLQNVRYSIFKQDHTNMSFEHIADVYNCEDDVYPNVIDATDENLVLNILSPDYLMEYLENNKLRFIFLNFNYYCSAIESGHQAFIMFDNQEKTVKIIDPNGSPGYFNDIFGLRVDEHIESMLANYFYLLKSGGVEYKYIPYYVWNKGNIMLNKSFNNENIGDGHCVVLTFLIMHILNVLECDIADVYKTLNSISNEELLYIIKDYTIALNQILQL